jgi:hypothetical protein
MRVNPAIDEPSIHWPRSTTSGKIPDGIVTLFTIPITSVNWRLMNSTFSSLIRA